MLDALLTPGAVAVIGASRTPGKVGYEVLQNLKEGGFAGDIVPINPSAEDVCGIPCHPDLPSYGKSIDLAVIAIPAPHVKDAIEASIEAGAKAVTVISAGFKEVGEDGKSRTCAHPAASASWAPTVSA